METVLRELGQTWRSLRRRPGFTAVAVATVALGIGANAAIFSVVRGVLLRPLPYESPEELVTLDVVSAQGYYISLSIPNYGDYRDRNRVFETFGAAAGWTLTRTGDGPAEVVNARMVLGEFFETLGVGAALGRVIPASETGPGAEAVVVLGHGYWERSFGGDPDVLGRTITLDGRPYTVVGVMPEGFGWTHPGVDLYAPMGVLAAGLPWEDRSSSFGTRAIARLAPGVARGGAVSDMARVTAEVDALEGRHVASVEVRTFGEYFLGDVRAGLWVLMGAVGLVLLIVCANVANLLIVRGEERRRELAVRAALGAARAGVVRFLLAESLLLSLAGGVLGLFLSVGAMRAMVGALPVEIPRLVAERIGVDATVLGFTMLLVLLTGLIFGLAPTLRSARIDLAVALKEGRGVTGGRHRLRSSLVVAQVALSLILLIGAGLLVRSLRELGRVDVGFDGSDVLMGELPREGDDDPDRWRALYDGVMERARALPGVQTVAATLLVPLSGSSWEIRIQPAHEAYDQERGRSVLFNVVSEDYFDALDIPILRGRAFNATDTDGAPLVAVIDEIMAERFWPGEDPVGKQVMFWTHPESTQDNPIPLYHTVVGVARNVRHYEIEEPSRIQVYIPYRQTGRYGGYDMTVLLETAGDPLALAPALRRITSDVDPDVPVADLQVVQANVDDELSGSRALGGMITIFGAAAMLLAALGIFGVTSTLVVQRTREIGVRMAVGAHAGDVLRLVTGHALRLGLVGVAVGLVAAAALSRLLAGFLFGVRPIDPVVYGALAVGLLAASALAALLPAHRAAHIDPARVLREG